METMIMKLPGCKDSEKDAKQGPLLVWRGSESEPGIEADGTLFVGRRYCFQINPAKNACTTLFRIIFLTGHLLARAPHKNDATVMQHN